MCIEVYNRIYNVRNKHSMTCTKTTKGVYKGICKVKSPKYFLLNSSKSILGK